MKKSLKKSLALLLALITILTTLAVSPFSAEAAVSTAAQLDKGTLTKLAIWADPQNLITQEDINNSSSDSLATLGSIQPMKLSTTNVVKAKYYWFFPSNANLNNLRIWFAQGTTLTIDGQNITSGEPTDVFASINDGGVSKDVSIKLGTANTASTVTVIKSGDVGTVYIDIDSSVTASGYLVNNFNDIHDKAHEKYATGTIMVVRPDGTIDYNGVMEKMTGRGNGTWNEGSGSKLPYNIKLGVSKSLLGMASAKKWCLLANKEDPSLIKNQLTYDFSDYIGINYQPHCKPVDLYVNQLYLGSYQLSEKVEIKSNKINLSADAYKNLELANGNRTETGAILPADLTGTSVVTRNENNSTVQTSSEISGAITNAADHTVGARRYSNITSPTDVTGGYLYEIEISNRWIKEGAGFCAYNRQGWVIKSADFVSKDMIDYNYDLLYALGSSVYNNGTVPSTSTTTNCSSLTVSTSGLNKKNNGAKSITNPAPATKYQGKRWNELLDADSAVKYYWTQEFFSNMDTSTSSTYFYKDSDSVDGKIYAGPVWDMDNALCYNKSNAKRWNHSYSETNDWYAKNARIYRWRSADSNMDYSSDSYSPLNFYAALATNCTDFWKMAETYYYRYIVPGVDIVLGNTVDPNGTLKTVDYYVNTVAKSGKMDAIRLELGSYDESTITANVRNWISGRNTWIDSQIPKTNISNASVSAIPSQPYTGKDITPVPAVSVTTSGVTTTLQKDVDCTYTYSNNINVGQGKITVTGKGNYTGTKDIYFNIVSSPIATNHSITIDSSTYAGTELVATLKRNRTDEDIYNGFTYQWYKNNEAISGATSDRYTVSDSDVGSVITCAAIGDGTNFTGRVESNECTVLSGTRPTGYSRTIATWNYDYTVNSAALANANSDDTDYFYNATGGELQSSATLHASVNGEDAAKIKWSSDTDLYTNPDQTATKDRNPVMGTSKQSNLAWDYFPYFEIVASTLNYDNLHFTARLGGTNKGPKIWQLYYSLDGEEYTEIEGAQYSITNNKDMQLAFNNVALPAECANQRKVYIRMEVYDDVSIGNGTIMYQTSGDAAVNNISLTGNSFTAVTSLEAPEIETPAFSQFYDTDRITINDTNGGADIYYSVNEEPFVRYTEPFNPYILEATPIGAPATIRAFAAYEDIQSETAESTVHFAGIKLNTFNYSDYSTDVTNGFVQSTGGVYGKSGRMTAYTDGSSQYVPLWNDKAKSFSISPDDGMMWTADSGFTYEVSTAGYESITFACDARTTSSGPKSLTLQYSVDGIRFIDVHTNKQVPNDTKLRNLFLSYTLPSECNNCAKLYIRLVTTENATCGSAEDPSTTLHNNRSKGNLYVNNVVISGIDNGDYKMPYTNKSTPYFGESGTIKYVSPDGAPMSYIVTDTSNNIVMAGTYPEGGIQLSKAAGFDATKQEQYRVAIQAGEDDSYSIVNDATYMYKGDTVVKFNYNDTTKIFDNYVSPDFLTVYNTSGVNRGSLSIYPNGSSKAPVTYTNTYGVKASWSDSNKFVATKNLDNPNGNGYWLITTSTLGYTDLTLNLEQLSSNNGPRDWGVAYSTNGSTYTYVANSNVRAISNDAVNDTVETYGNLPLPSACDNQNTLYLKIFINGGEAVDGDELSDMIKGNTGINNIEISGIPEAKIIDVSATIPQPDRGTITDNKLVGANVLVNGASIAVTGNDGHASVRVPKGKDVTINVVFDGNVKSNDIIVAADDTNAQTVELNIFDYNNDGYVNAKDFGRINSSPAYADYKSIFNQYISIS